ncbi:MAG: hypothetical protein IH946_09985 [Bacteroidetes bacterium]|nr:hypothetical protein [Bacteroidota bacterium]
MNKAYLSYIMTIIAGLIIMSVSVQYSYAQSSSILTIKGKVIENIKVDNDIREQIVTDALVVLFNENYEAIETLATDRSGVFLLPVRANHKYTVVLRKNDYITARTKIRTPAAFESDVEEIKFVLRRASEDDIITTRYVEKKVLANLDAIENKFEENKIKFMIQLGSFKNEISTSKFPQFDDINMKLNGKYFSYFSGSFTEFVEAREFLIRVRRLGYSDAFITAYQNNKKLPVVRAIQKLAHK